MQSLALVLVVVTSSSALAQDAPGTQLWRLAAATLPLPPALATGGAAGMWNPAQPETQSIVALEVIQTPATVGVSGFVGVVRVHAGPLGRIGLAYGRMAIRDLVRTSLSPDPDGGSIPYYTHTARAQWSRGFGATTLGAAVAFHETHIDQGTHDRSWTVDVGARHQVGSRLVIAAATHFFERFASDPAQDLFGGIQFRVWQGELWSGSGQAAVDARYGVALGHGFEADHQFGTGLDVGGVFAADLEVVREGSYEGAAWRPVAGVRLRIGRYRLLFAGDAGPRQIGAAYRVGLEARIR